MLEPGAEIDGRFVVEALIGQGGLAEVYRVRHLELGSLHALKLLVWKKKQLEDRLLLEGRIQAQLRHPNVVAVTDLVRYDGQVGLLMEYVDHESLEDFLQRGGALATEDALRLLAPILSGVTAAHDAGVLHRDLKPANVMLARSAAGLTPKVTDFGIAKVVQEVQGGRTAAGVTMGTPGYLAPEQILDSADADQRADVFALGAILYEMLSGRRAFADAAGEVSVRSTLEGEVQPLAELVDGLEPAVAEAVHRALERDRDARFEDCRAFASALFADRAPLLAMVSGQHVGGPLSLSGGAVVFAENTTIAPVGSPSLETFLPIDPPVTPPEPPGPPVGSSGPNLVLVGGALGVVAVLAVLGVGWAVFPATPDPAVPVLVEEPVVKSLVSGERPVEDVPAPVVEPVAAPPRPTPVAPRPVAAPAPVIAPEVPEPAVAPIPEPAVAPVPEPAVAPVPEPAVAVVVAPAAPLVIPDTGALVGLWKGMANGRPLELRIAAIDGASLGGELTFYLGPTARTVPAEGTIDASTGKLVIRGGDFTLSGTAGGLSMAGTYTAGKKTLPWTLAKGG